MSGPIFRIVFPVHAKDHHLWVGDGLVHKIMKFDWMRLLSFVGHLRPHARLPVGAHQ